MVTSCKYFNTRTILKIDFNPPFSCQVHPKDKETNFVGACNFHPSSCIETFTSNYSIAKRLGCAIEDLPGIPDDHEVWEIVGFYLAQLCTNICLLTTPKSIVLSGGVMKRTVLYKIVREKFTEMINSYVDFGDVEKLIRPALLADSGLVGAAILRK